MSGRLRTRRYKDQRFYRFGAEESLFFVLALFQKRTDIFHCVHCDRYDFAVYGLLAPEIGAAFFPDSSSELQLINSFGVYLAAFLMR